MPAMALSSPLSSLTSPSPSSFYTATAGTPSHVGDTTTASSPGEPGAALPYRDARQLPHELKEHCQIYLEEQMYNAAIHLLESLLCAGESQPYARTRPTLVPPPSQIAYLATLAIHPAHTSRISERGHHEVSSQSLTYLRSLLAVVGPVNANLRAAFEFREQQRTRRPNVFDGSNSDDEESGEEHIRGSLANAGSVWSRGQDFWKVLGWAFNCSGIHPHRWRYWKPWLEYLLDVLDADWDERKRLDKEAHERGGGQGTVGSRSLQESLLMCYVVPRNNRSNPLKPIMSALFADGSDSSLAVYPEVFEKERKGISKNQNKRKRAQLDLEKEKFGDYYDTDSLSSSGGSQPPTPEKTRIMAALEDDPPTWKTSGLAESVPLRLRLFALLSKATNDVPDQRFIQMDELYDQFTRRMHSLPLDAFEIFLAASSNINNVAYISILRELMPSFLPASAPDPGRIDPRTDHENGVSVPILERCFLPFAAKAVVEVNAKFSLVLEAMFQEVWMQGGVPYTKSFEAAIEKGIKLRNEKAKGKKPGRGKTDADEEAAKSVLAASSQRLLTLLAIVKAEGTATD